MIKHEHNTHTHTHTHTNTRSFKLQGVGSSHSRVYVGVGDKVVGAIDVQDALRLDAQQTIADLHRCGVRTIMLSGDR